MIDKVRFENIKQIVTSMGFKLEMVCQEYTNNKNIKISCKHGEIMIKSLVDIKRGKGCAKACKYEKRVKKIDIVDSHNISIERGNLLAQRKASEQELEKYGDDNIKNTLQLATRNKILFPEYIQLSELLTLASLQTNGWIYHMINNNGIFIHKHGIFSVCAGGNPSYILQRAFKNKYPQIKLCQKMVYIHRVYGQCFISCDLSQYYDDGSFDKIHVNDYLSKLKTQNINDIYIHSIQQTIQPNVKYIIIPNQNLISDHISTIENFIHTQWTTAKGNVEMAVQRGERPNLNNVLLFDTQLMKPVTFDNKWCFTVSELSTILYKQSNKELPPTPTNLVGTSLKKANTRFNNSSFPSVFTLEDVKLWTCPILHTLVDRNYIVLSLHMFWSFIKDKPRLQEEYNLYTPIESRQEQHVGKYHKLKDVEHLLYLYPFNTRIGFLTNIDKFQYETIFQPVSVNGDKVRELKSHRDKNEYMYIQLDGKHFYLHRLLGIMFPNKNDIDRFCIDNSINFKHFVINHRDGNVSDYHPSNLNWLSRSENSKQTHIFRTPEYLTNLHLERQNWKADIVFDYSMYKIIE